MNTMSTQTSILYTYRSPWPRRLAAGCAIVLLVVAGVAGYRLLQPADSIGPVAQSSPKVR